MTTPPLAACFRNSVERKKDAMLLTVIDNGRVNPNGVREYADRVQTLEQSFRRLRLVVRMTFGLQ